MATIRCASPRSSTGAASSSVSLAASANRSREPPIPRDVEREQGEVPAGGRSRDRGDERQEVLGGVEAEPGADERAADRRRESRDLSGPPSRGSPRPSTRRGRPGRRPRARRAARRRAGAGHRRDDDQDAEEPAAEAEHDRVERPERGAGLAPEAPAPVHARAIAQQRQHGEQREPDHRARDALAERRLRDLGREVDRLRRVVRASTRPLSKYVLIRWLPAFGCCVQKESVCPNPGSTTWWPFGR